MNFMNYMTPAGLIEPEVTEATEAAKLVFQPGNFVENLQYMGIGMLVIFVVIGVIALTTVLINKIFSK